MSCREIKSESTDSRPVVRCAIYTRKSSEEGLDQEFNSLDAQRDAGEFFISSQQHEGWVCLPDHYDDGGFSGGNMERPGMRCLMADIRAGKVDCVVVYKVDRLSRSLMDFARVMETFEKHKVSFVSVTQQFNTVHSMGRLTLNILLSFAQFEREIIGERIRDKIAAQRRRGKWAGGTPVLGYDVCRSTGSPRIIVNKAEAGRVRRIFELYLKTESLLQTARDLNRRGWKTKEWITKKGIVKGGREFDKCKLHTLLTNLIYIGKIKHKTTYYDGEHEAIVLDDLFRSVQEMLQHNHRTGGVEVRNKYGALLRGLIFCRPCDRALVHTFTGRGSKRYRYYTCTKAIKSGWDRCATKSLPAGEIEKAVVEQIRCISQDQSLLDETLRQARVRAEQEIERLKGERRSTERILRSLHTDVRKLATEGSASSLTTNRIDELHDRIRREEQQLEEVVKQIAEYKAQLINETDLASAFTNFDNIWNALSPREQARVLRLLIQRIEFDPTESTIAITFHASEIKALTEGQIEEAA